MKIPDINKQNKEDITEKIKYLSTTYTPEWKFDIKNPDAGTAVATIFGEMHNNMLIKYNQLTKKNMIEFFKYIGADILPANPAIGYVSFGLVSNDVEAVDVMQGTKVLADNADDTVTFETLNSLRVVPSNIKNSFQVLPKQDGIYHIFSQNETQNTFGNFKLFCENGKNIQKHELYICHEYVAYLMDKGCITINFRPTKDRQYSQKMLYSFDNPELFVAEYSTENGFERFEQVKYSNNSLKLYKSKHQPKSSQIELFDTNGIWIRLKCMDINIFNEFIFDILSISSEIESISPDFVVAANIEQKSHEYMPFGEKMGLYEEVYFGSDQVLMQKGSNITLSFNLRFKEIEIQSDNNQNIDWKLIMKQNAFLGQRTYDVGIHEVIWEYYNGNDWRKLPESDLYKNIFNSDTSKTERKVQITFKCPNDLQPILVQSVFIRAIRARIIKMENEYQWNGKYIAPIINNTNFNYKYNYPYPTPDLAVCQNNLQIKYYTKQMLSSGKELITPFLKTEETKPVLYIGFDNPFDNGPIRILVNIEKHKQFNLALKFEYFNGRKWVEINTIDETEGFQKTGILTFLGHFEFKSHTLFGVEQYWIRVTSEDKIVDSIQPYILSMYMNATEVMAVSTMQPEYFVIDSVEKDRQIQLSDNSVYSAQVWVKESSRYSREQLKKISEEYHIKYGKTNDEKDLWILWKERPNFVLSSPEDRHYILDRNDGKIIFSNGINGKMLSYGDEVCVEYRCGGGKSGNVEAGNINRLESTIGYISNVKNPWATAGGTDKEDIFRAIKRKSQFLRHRNKAVTPKDYEALALESSSSIMSANCFPNYNENGEKSSGQITLVLLMYQHYKNRNYFKDIAKSCFTYLKNRIPSGLIENNRLHIIEPKFVLISTYIKIKVADINTVLEVRHKILNSIDNFFDPLNGNFNKRGWKIGQIPNIIQISNFINGIEGVKHINSLRIQACVEKNGQWVEIDYDELSNDPFVLAVSGKHDIDVTVGEGW